MGLLDFLKQSLAPASGTQQDDVESIRKISRELESMDPVQAKFLAAFAYLLGRVANSDSHISPEEGEAMERIVMDKGHLSQTQAVMTVEISKRQNRLFGHVENFLVSREFNEVASRQQKLDLLDCLFAVCASDRSISSIEDREIRQVASELLLEHRDFIEIRSRYRNYLDVLKRPEE